MKISPRYFAGSYAAGLLGGSQPQITRFLENSGQEQRIRLLMLDLWGRICIDGADTGAMTELLRRHVTY